MRFKKKKGWISPETYGRILSLLLSPNDDDFEIGVMLLEKHNISPSRLLNKNSKEAVNSEFIFRKRFGKLTRSKNKGYEMFIQNPNGIFVKDPQMFTGVFTNRIKI